MKRRAREMGTAMAMAAAMRATGMSLAPKRRRLM
jgi:hypothetical protein